MKWIIKFINKIINPNNWHKVYSDAVTQHPIWYDADGYPYKETFPSYYEIYYSDVLNKYEFRVSGYNPFNHPKYIVAKEKYDQFLEMQNKQN